MQKIGLLLIMLCFTWGLKAQEFNFEVSVNTPMLQMTDPKVFETLETAIEEFFNNQTWTDDTFEPEERIKGNIQLTIEEELGNNRFKAQFAIQSSRPVYKSGYETALLSHVDRHVTFKYEQFQPLIYTPNNYNDNLISILSFYAYIVLGLDYDSFSPMGGDPHFLVAQEILNTVPSTVTGANKGWTANDGPRSRYWMIDNILTPRVRDLRQAMYEYHRQGLDFMHQSTDFGRGKLMAALETCAKVNKSFPNMMVVQMFVNAKSSEIIEIFKQGTSNEKKRVIEIMSQLDAAGSGKYVAIGR